MLLCAGLVLQGAAPAQAARFTLLSLEGFSQSVAASYDYQNSYTSYQDARTGSTEHGVSESYSISSGYSILHPRLLRGTASLAVTADQELADDSELGDRSGGDNRLSYNLQGILLDRTSFPVNFSAASARYTIRPPFDTSYRVDSGSWNVTWNLKNRLLPASLFLGSSSSATSGAASNTRNGSRSARLSLRHQVAQFSESNLALSLDDYEQNLLDYGTRDEHTEGGADLSNALSWRGPRELQRRLNTRYTYRKRNGGSAGLTDSLASDLRWQIGKSLDGTLRYTRTRNKDEVRSSALQSLSATLSQRYLKALQTNLGASFSRGSYSDGSDLTGSGSLALTYSKELPKGGRATLNYACQYQLQERRRSDFELSVLTTLQPGDLYPRIVDLADRDIVASTLQIFLDEARSLPFSDFSIVLSGALTRIVLNSNPGVPLLYLSYSYRQSPDVTYATTTQAAGSGLSLYGGKLSLQAHYSWSDSDLIAGSDPSSTLGDSSHLKLSAEGILAPHTFTLSYSADDGAYQELHNVEAKWTHTLQGKGASLLSRVEERYSWFANKSSTTGGGDGWDNTFQCSTAYSRTLNPNLKGKLDLAYLNLAAGGTVSNKINLGFSLTGHYGRTLVSLDGAANFGFSSSGSSRNQSVSLNVRRVFR